MNKCIVKDMSLAKEGKRKIEWVRSHMPLLHAIEREYAETKPFRNHKISLSIHLEAKTAYLAIVFAVGGAEIAVTGSNPFSTKDDVAAALAEHGIHVYALYGVKEEKYWELVDNTLSIEPNIIIDDGGDLVNRMHTHYPELCETVIGACEETTAGVLRDIAREKEGTLYFPVFAINDAYCKHLFDNRHGTGQSTWDAIMRTTNLMITGKTVVIAGYGWVGKGCALRAKGLGADVIVTEVDPVKALEAVMEGFRVMPMSQASKIGDIFVTTTGNKNVLRKEHFLCMKNGVILANTGHFDKEISVSELETAAIEKNEPRDQISGYQLENNRWLYLIGGGKIVNISSGDGHPAEIMDMSFALQLLSANHIISKKGTFSNSVHKVPREIDYHVAQKKLETLNISIDELTPEQKNYLESWNHSS